MNRAQAQKMAEGDVCELSRGGGLQKSKEGRSTPDYEQASKLFRQALRDLSGLYDSETLEITDVISLGAIAVELYREALLHNYPGELQPPDDFVELDDNGREN